MQFRSSTTFLPGAPRLAVLMHLGGMAATRAVEELMNALPIQLANAPAPPVAASSVSGGAPTGDGGFAATLGRVLDGMSDSRVNGAALAPKATPRAKPADDGTSSSAALGGVLPNYLVSNFVRPAPAAMLGMGSVETTVVNPAATLESSVDSPPSFASSLASNLGTSAGAPGAGRLLQLPATEGSTSVSNLSPVGGGQIAGNVQSLETGEGASLGVAANGVATEDRKIKSAGDGLAIGNPSNEIVPAKKNASANDPSAAPVSGAAWIPAGLSTAAFNPSPGELTAETTSTTAGFIGSQSATVGTPSAKSTAKEDSAQSDSLSASTAVPTTDPGAWNGQPAAPSPAALGDDLSAATWVASDLMPHSGLPMPSAGQSLHARESGESSQVPTSGQDFDSSSSTTPSGPMAKGNAAPGPQAGKPGVAASASDQDALAEFSAALEKFSDVKTSIGKSEGGAARATVPSAARIGMGSPAQSVISRNAPDKIAGNFVQTAAVTAGKNPANIPAKPADHSPTPAAANNAAGQKVPGPDVAATQVAADPPSSFGEALGIAPMSGLSAMNLPQKNGVAPESNGNQADVQAVASTGDSSAAAGPSDTSTPGQGKSGQQSGTGPETNPPAPAAHSAASSPGPDPAGNLLTAHTPTVSASHNIPSNPPMPSSSTQPASTLSAWQNYDGGAGRIVRSASLTDSAGGAEMHVELRSGPLGPLELHTMVREGSVGAEIHVQGQEAHSILSAGLPSLERALNDRNLHVENISVYQDHTGGGMSGGERQGSQPQSSPMPRHQPSAWDRAAHPALEASSSSESEELINPAAGLSVRA